MSTPPNASTGAAPPLARPLLGRRNSLTFKDAYQALARKANREDDNVELSAYASIESCAPRVRGLNRPIATGQVTGVEDPGAAHPAVGTSRHGPGTPGAVRGGYSFKGVDAAHQPADLENVDPEVRQAMHELFFTHQSARDNAKAAKEQDAPPKPWDSALHTARKVKKFAAGTMPYATKLASVNPITDFVVLCLRGFGQCFFMNSPLTGAFLCAAVFWHSEHAGVHAVVGVVFANLSAIFFGFNGFLMRCGLFGYNGVLTALALELFHTMGGGGWDWRLTVAVAMMSALTTVIWVALGKVLMPYKVPPFALPFNFAVLLWMAATSGMARFSIMPGQTPAFPTYPDRTNPDFPPFKDFLEAWYNGCGQLMFGLGHGPTALLLVGIALCSRISAVAALWGAFTGTCWAYVLGADEFTTGIGLWAYNSALTAGAVFGMFYVPSVATFLLVIVSSFVCVLLQAALNTMLAPVGLPSLSLPFCFTSLLFVLLQGATSKFVAVPLTAMTIPEDHYTRVKVLRDVFKVFKRLLDDSVPSQSLFDHYSAQGKKNVNPMLARKIFDTIDVDHGETLQYEELAGVMNAAGATESSVEFLRQVFVAMDKDKSGDIDFEEFKAYVEASSGLRSLKVDLEQFFQYVDADGSGGVSVTEIRQTSETLGAIPLTPAEMDKLMDVMGLDDEGQEFHRDEMVNKMVLTLLEPDGGVDLAIVDGAPPAPPPADAV